MVVKSPSMLLALVVACAASSVSCAASGVATRNGSVVPSVMLAGPGAAPLDARALAGDAAYTVFVFFSPDCHCLEQHETRLRAVDAAFRPRDVHFFMVDSEVRASVERDADEARRRGYSFPILVDRGARLADAVGADYATYSVVVDREGRLRFRGGIDSDRDHLRSDAIPYLSDALTDLLDGREPRIADAKALGCALQKW
jgi:hypothetical protein